MEDQLANRLRSWAYWTEKFKAFPNEKFIFGKTPAIVWDQIYPICIFCEGFKQAKDPITGVSYYCVCSMSRWMEERKMKSSPLETVIRPALLKDLQVLKRYPGAGTLQELKQRISQWIPNPKTWYLISGNKGCGKTHILRAIKNALGPMAFYISSEDLNSLIFEALNKKTINELVLFLSSSPVLLLDDLGIEHTNTMFTDVVAQVINRRYNANPDNYPVVITTNLSISEMLSSPDGGISRVASRMCDEQFSSVWKLEQPDYRLSTTKKE